MKRIDVTYTPGVHYEWNLGPWPPKQLRRIKKILKSDRMFKIPKRGLVNTLVVK